MSVWSGDVRLYRLVRWTTAGLVFVLVLAALGAAEAERVHADGGLPVTPTFTASPTVTNTPTQAFFLIPTDTSVPLLQLPATNTPVVEAGLPPYPLVTPLPPLGLVTDPTVGPTTDAQPAICWTLPIAFIVIVIILLSSFSFWRRYHPV